MQDFFEDWFKEIERLNGYWIARIRQGRSLQLQEAGPRISVTEFIKQKIRAKTTNYPQVKLTKTHQHVCRIITNHEKHSGKKRKQTASLKKNRHAASGSYLKAAQEPWILATNLPAECSTTQVVKYYKKRMQIEESFRDMKSHQFGLSGRYIRTTDVNRWGVKMLLAAIVQIIYWVIGIIGHQQGMQKYFQVNTVRDKKVFSNFTLGQLIIEHNKLSELRINYENLPSIIEVVLADA